MTATVEFPTARTEVHNAGGVGSGPPPQTRLGVRQPRVAHTLDRGTHRALITAVDEGTTIHGVGVAPERPSRVEGLTRALDIPDEPTIPNTPPAPIAPPVLAAQDAPWRGELKRNPHRFFANALADPETTMHGRAAPLPYAAAPAPVRVFPRGKIIALFVGGVLFGLALGAIVLVT